MRDKAINLEKFKTELQLNARLSSWLILGMRKPSIQNEPVQIRTSYKLHQATWK